MKKILSIIICIVIVSIGVCGCTSSKNEDGQKDIKESSVSDADTNVKDSEKPTVTTVDLSSYVKPADAVSIDLAKAAPSTADMSFTYDELGRVSVCTYKIGTQTVKAVYSYEENSAQIYAFIGDVVIADDLISLSDFDKDLGFTVINGYYFKGYASDFIAV